ncbi:uncharacterized protein N0V89_000121 [Didymosphaeria variabile]|uniref:Mid2 domain-containing protein n=1 Tax=Didymosphaeria variabile TaxID=1932322 RepID=A0A9W8XUM5_9PLEO|nr:uncharacterized protein N0V89_000121 [Didymosphaeria variabile]KAJ4359566.1 hypothetical protein N0V89_000121 [Didymosphaeria variabile]
MQPGLDVLICALVTMSISPAMDNANRGVGNVAAGVSIHDCGDNIYCCGGDTEKACCTDERAFYVDPDNGGVTQTTVAAKTKAPRWFTVDSSSILASESGSSMASSTSAPAKTPASSSATATASATSSAAPDPTESTESSSTISAGAGAGIGIGAAAGVVLVGVLVWFLLRRRKQASHGAVSEVHGDATTMEKSGQDYYAHHGAPPSELDNAYPASQELPPNTVTHELDGTVGPAKRL